MKDSRRQEIGYGLAGKLNKGIKCRVIHKVNTELLCLSLTVIRDVTRADRLLN